MFEEIRRQEYLWDFRKIFYLISPSNYQRIGVKSRTKFIPCPQPLRPGSSAGFSPEKSDHSQLVTLLPISWFCRYTSFVNEKYSTPRQTYRILLSHSCPDHIPAHRNVSPRIIQCKELSKSLEIKRFLCETCI